VGKNTEHTRKNKKSHQKLLHICSIPEGSIGQYAYAGILP